MEVEKQLGFLKQQCENIDSELLILLKRRFQTEKRMIEAKLKNGLDVIDPNREIDVIDFVLKKAREMDISDSFIHQLYGVILDYNGNLQKDFVESKKK